MSQIVALSMLFIFLRARHHTKHIARTFVAGFAPANLESTSEQRKSSSVAWADLLVPSDVEHAADHLEQQHDSSTPEWSFADNNWEPALAPARLECRWECSTTETSYCSTADEDHAETGWAFC